LESVSSADWFCAGSPHLASAESNALPPVHHSQAATNGELAEDMLQMALRMAEMQSEPNLDLEDAVDPSPIRARGMALLSCY